MGYPAGLTGKSSLDSIIHDLEYVIDDTERDDVQQEMQKQKKKQNAILALTKRKRMLETEKETIQQKPAMDLMAETKQFREDVFKRRYRAKNLANEYFFYLPFWGSTSNSHV